ncbi:tyrosine-type recombinase/integrase [Priestia megaterium]|uniref:tyrosine-type recombinase/integrase n=3 Tax=Priestia megaterium TaxID=1404 RepID=UPI002452F3F1|nr:phage integrase SAM-like domain-containing protein [Priestia megaterium]MDH3142600.1 phage integrase SAM-like domain-containing protein [Priestia megaterium]MED4239221.1 phage integrase SAM-like domain-containing protein [Priestia megaterium]MED4255331.1 phage integrase SAM-like domain-containing protein [Priestia megaterium]MED4262966.1 phage integrase SAM-like domain-containing protein [Priestia megaterium]MED4274646.1 phage integrase SAM-like domain-containing protein [Priestia megateriu
MCAKRIRKGAKVAQINLEEAKEKIIKIKTLEGMAQSTLNQYNLVFNDLIAFFEKDTRVDDITLNDARDFINWLLHEKSDTSSKFKQVAKKGVKASSVNNYLQKTRAAFNILKREGVLSENVFNEIRNVKFQKHKVETLTVDEIKRIFNAFNKSYYAQYNWNDALCYRLIKEQFILNGGVFNPEIIKGKYEGAYAYIYNQHGSFEEFLNTFDLQDYVEINNTIYSDEIVVRKIKEAFTLYGNKVYSSWLHENGFGGVAIYLTRKGGGSFIKGANQLELNEYVISRYIDWTDELVLEKINEMLKEKGQVLISADFVTYKLTGMRDWIIKTHGGLKEFFVKYNMEDKFANMKHLGKELWSYGLQFEELAKEAIELLFNEVSYNKWIDNVRPDFIINEDIWIDAKLSSFAYFTDDTVKKYTARKECRELWLLYLRGHKFNHGNEDIKLISIEEWYNSLIKLGRADLVEKFDDLRDTVYEKEKTEGKRINK